MASTYTTIQGDTWDLMAYRFYGDEKYMRYLIEANRPLIDTLVFSSGTVVNVPDLPDEPDEDAPYWRTEDDGEDEYEYGEDEEDE